MKKFVNAEIPLEHIEVGMSQARTRDVSKNINELRESIRVMGLLEPIVLAKIDENQYEVITGQRRFLAVSDLGWTTISARILEERPNEDLSKAISLTENMVREDMPTKDYIDVCTTLYHKYGTIAAVSEELGLPYHRVSKYVKFDQLCPALKERVKEKGLKLDIALRAQRAASARCFGEEVDEEEALAFAAELENMSNPQQRQLEKTVADNPDETLEEVIERSRKQPKETYLQIRMSQELRTALNRFADEEETEPASAAVDMIEEALVDAGYANR